MRLTLGTHNTYVPLCNVVFALFRPYVCRLSDNAPQ